MSGFINVDMTKVAGKAQLGGMDSVAERDGLCGSLCGPVPVDAYTNHYRSREHVQPSYRNETYSWSTQFAIPTL